MDQENQLQTETIIESQELNVDLETDKESLNKSESKSAFQLSDIVWARTDSEGKLFWPAKICEEGEPGSNLWQNESQLHVRFYWPPSNKQTGTKIESRWVTTQKDVVPFERSKDFVLFYEERIGKAYIKAAVRLQRKCPEGQKWRVNLTSNAVVAWMKENDYVDPDIGSPNEGGIADENMDENSRTDAIFEATTITNSGTGHILLPNSTHHENVVIKTQFEEGKNCPLVPPNITPKTDQRIMSSIKPINVDTEPAKQILEKITFTQLLKHLLTKLQKEDQEDIFAEPVPVDLIPDYLDVVKKPMDFSTIKRKVKDNLYSNLKGFQKDLELMCNNAMLYNPKKSIYWKAAENLLKFGKRVLAPVKLQKVLIDFQLSVDISNEQLGFEFDPSGKDPHINQKSKEKFSEHESQSKLKTREKDIKHETPKQPSKKRRKFDETLNENDLMDNYADAYDVDQPKTVRQTRRANGIDKSINSPEMLSEISRQQALKDDEDRKILQRKKSRKSKEIDDSMFNAVSEDSGVGDDIEKSKKKRKTNIKSTSGMSDESTIEFSEESNSSIEQIRNDEIVNRGNKLVKRKFFNQDDEEVIGYTKDKTPIKADQRNIDPCTVQLLSSNKTWTISPDEEMAVKSQNIEQKRPKKSPIKSSDDSDSEILRNILEYADEEQIGKGKKRSKKKESKPKESFDANALDLPLTHDTPTKPISINLPTQPLPTAHASE